MHWAGPMGAGPRLAVWALAALLAVVTGGAALAATGQPTPWQVGMQPAVTGVAGEVVVFHTALVWLITGICIFVAVLLVWCIVRFNETKNPIPSRTSHNTLIEVAWTIIPVLILVAIAIPSFRVLRDQLIVPTPDVVVKVTGHAWYWSYEYPQDQGGFEFVSNLVEEGDLQPGQPRLLAVDNEFVVPVNRVIHVQVTAADVIHAFGVPSLGVKIDAIPGRLNETWFRATREGLYYGQCYELCGARHAYMPIAVRVVSEEQYAQWLAEAQQRFAGAGTGGRLAAAEAPAH